METKTDEVLDLLVKGRQYLADHEWHRGEFFEVRYDEERDDWRADRSKCCGLGAVLAGSGLDYDYIDNSGSVWREVRGALGVATAECSTDDFAFYNDHVAKSKEDVLAVFDRAIAARRGSAA